MNTRTIDLTNKVTITPAAGGRITIRDDESVEVVKPPTGRVYLRRYRDKRSDEATLHFGSPSRSTLLINGLYRDVSKIFEAITGVAPKL